MMGKSLPTRKLVRAELYRLLRSFREHMIRVSGYEFGTELEALQTVELRSWVDDTIKRIFIVN